jgi:isopentenyl-diphosphate delta-isomerase type 1
MNAEEIFDVVDERDVVIGQRTRRDVHQLGLRHRAVHVLVFNSRGDVFLQKRSLAKDCYPGCWDSSASGHLAPGETYDQCAVRESQEELGLQLAEPPLKLFKLAACPETGQEFVWVYRCSADGPFHLHPEEIESGDWFSPETVNSWVTTRPGEFARAFILVWRTFWKAG